MSVVFLAAFAFSTREPAPREVVLEARNMAFVSPATGAAPKANPTLVLRAGERIRLVVRNLDPGMRHDLVVEGLEVWIDVPGYGDSGQAVVTVPRARGEHDYFCSYHARVMRGRMLVR